jgi:uncharacterized protein (TIGR02246 family)
MKKPVVAVILMSCAASLPALAQEDDKVRTEVQGVLQQHDQALNEQNLDAVMATYASDPKIVLMGTGPGEFWVGKQEIADTYKHFFEDFKKGSLKHECPWKLGGYQGDVAWLTASCQMRDIRQDKPNEYVANISAVMRKQDGAWRFQTLHFSNLTGGGQ